MNENNSLNSRHKPYPSYHKTEFDTVGIIPVGWMVRRLKHLASVRFSNVDKHINENERQVRLCNYTDVYNNDVISSGMEFMEATADDREIKQFAIKKGDVLITKDSEDWRDIAVPAYVGDSNEGILCGYHLAQIRPRGKVVSGRYLSMCFNALSIKHQYKIASVGITRYGLGKYWIDNSLITIPPLKEQIAITGFLYRETARIDELISKKERMIELLQEKRQAIITHAVTKGLDPNAPMRDSGIAWLGRVPAHWGTFALKRIGRIRYGLGEPPNMSSEGIPFIRATNVFRGSIVEEDMRYVKKEDVPRGTKSLLREGEIIVVRSGAYTGDSALIPSRYDGAIAGYDMVLTIHSGSSHFISYALLSDYVLKSQIYLSKLRAAQPHLNAEELGECLVLCPNELEQEEIARYITVQIENIESLISKIRRAIEKLKEYRQALITAAVTGQIDVRGEVA